MVLVLVVCFCGTQRVPSSACSLGTAVRPPAE